ncbi:MAG: cation diffusion facilitator family transporter [Myxococcota bacterium]|jgi:cation diffusion facilitator family transporter|nr:cation diffusion facilitator family transporter [Myxococcota bacterium]
MEAGVTKSNAAIVSVLSNIVLVVFKIAAGVAMGSVSVISEAIHSGIDLLAAIIALLAVRTASRPPDETHPYGHGKFENLSGVVEALLIFCAAGWIIYEAIHRLLSPAPIGSLGLGTLVMGISAVVNLGVSSWLMKVAKRTESIALEADAWHLRTDVYTSVGVMAGLGSIWLLGVLMPGVDVNWLDPMVAIAVALLILSTAWKLTLSAVGGLLDNRLPREEELWIARYLKSLRPRITGFHRLRTRKAGSDRFVEFHMLVREEMTVKNAHDISDEVVCRIREEFRGAHVIVHIEPCDGSCKPLCLEGCLIAPGERPSRPPG